MSKLFFIFFNKNLITYVTFYAATITDKLNYVFARILETVTTPVPVVTR